MFGKPLVIHAVSNGFVVEEQNGNPHQPEPHKTFVFADITALNEWIKRHFVETFVTTRTGTTIVHKGLKHTKIKGNTVHAR
jgi:hypothetical protein